MLGANFDTFQNEFNIDTWLSFHRCVGKVSVFPQKLRPEDVNHTRDIQHTWLSF